MILKLGCQSPVMYQILRPSYSSFQREMLKTKQKEKNMHGKVNYEKLIRCLSRSVAYKVSCGTVLLCLKPGKIISEAEIFSFNSEWF